MFSLQAEGLHGNHKDINAYHRTDYQYILIQFISTTALRLKQLPNSSPHATIPLRLFRIALNICNKKYARMSIKGREDLQYIQI